jgi:hypothetical protein
MGGDQVLEAHVTYFEREVGGERVLTTPSAHVRSGTLLDGLTLQFMRGTSWKGNIYVSAADWENMGLDASLCRNSARPNSPARRSPSCPAGGR